MNKLRDIFYDKNDILVAFLIVAVAALVILIKVHSIMAYPQTLVADAKDSNQEQVTYNSGDDSTEPVDSQNSGAVTPAGTDTPADTNTGTPNDTGKPEMYAIYINYGETPYAIGQKLADVGLMDSPNAFVTLVEANNAATKIQAGNFIIPSTATPQEVLGYLTN